MLLLMMRYVVYCLTYRVSFLSFLHDTINQGSLWSAHRSTLSGRLDVDLHVATIRCYAPSKTNVLFSAPHVGASSGFVQRRKPSLGHDVEMNYEQRAFRAGQLQ
jgi:hypothetical protein